MRGDSRPGRGTALLPLALLLAALVAGCLAPAKPVALPPSDGCVGTSCPATFANRTIAGLPLGSLVAVETRGSAAFWFGGLAASEFLVAWTQAPANGTGSDLVALDRKTGELHLAYSERDQLVLLPLVVGSKVMFNVGPQRTAQSGWSAWQWDLASRSPARQVTEGFVMQWDGEWMLGAPGPGMPKWVLPTTAPAGSDPNRPPTKATLEEGPKARLATQHGLARMGVYLHGNTLHALHGDGESAIVVLQDPATQQETGVVPLKLAASSFLPVPHGWLLESKSGLWLQRPSGDLQPLLANQTASNLRAQGAWALYDVTSPQGLQLRLEAKPLIGNASSEAAGSQGGRRGGSPPAAPRAFVVLAAPGQDTPSRMLFAGERALTPDGLFVAVTARGSGTSEAWRLAWVPLPPQAL